MLVQCDQSVQLSELLLKMMLFPSSKTNDSHEFQVLYARGSHFVVSDEDANDAILRLNYGSVESVVI